jgi:hypothetical protein
VPEPHRETSSKGRQLSTDHTKHRQSTPDRAAGGPHTSASAGEFAALFASGTRTPLRTFLPGRRVWLILGVATVVIALVAAVVGGLPLLHLGKGQIRASAQHATENVPHPPESDTAPSPSPAGKGAHPAAGKSSSPSPSPSGTLDAGSKAHANQPPSAAPAQQAGSAVSSSSSTPSGAPNAHSGFLTASGSAAKNSGNYWGEDDVSFTSTVPLSGLRVVVRVAKTGSLTSAGSWSTFGNESNVSVTGNGDAITYLVTLKPGVTLPPGRYTFAAQFNNPGYRSAHGDVYDVNGTAAATGASQNTQGNF